MEKRVLRLSLICIFTLLCIIQPAIPGRKAWRPKLGTFRYPKYPNLGTRIREGDVFKWTGIGYFRAKQGGILGLAPYIGEPLKTKSAEHPWLQLKRGSILLPRRLKYHGEIKKGDVYIDRKSSILYEAVANATLRTKQIAGQSFQRFDRKGMFRTLTIKPEWMTLLNPIIGDKRLGDIVIPGTHDSATWAITRKSILVQKTTIFNLAKIFAPHIIKDWSKTQTGDLSDQLNAGFRWFDLRIADTGTGSKQGFRWWHGMAGDKIEGGLDEIIAFARAHPQEVLILDFCHFNSPGDANNELLPISSSRKDAIVNILLSKLSSRLVPYSTVGMNPTINQVLATGKNIVAVVQDSYMSSKSDLLWSDYIYNAWVAKTNPEELFVERSEKLAFFKNYRPFQMTALDGAVTPSDKNIIGGLLNSHGDGFFVRLFLQTFLPQYGKLYAHEMSFEGLFSDIITMARTGVNTSGMKARNSKLYTHGGSVHYSGVNDMLRFWVARPDLYKPNIVHVDDYISSTIVDTAISANKGDIKREVSIAHQGNARDGYLEWNGYESSGGASGLSCSPGWARYQLKSASTQLDESWKSFSEQGIVTFAEGQYPSDTEVIIQVGSNGSAWNEILKRNIQAMIQTNDDTYLRVANTGAGHGFAYTSSMYNHFGATCTSEPQNASVIVRW